MLKDYESYYDKLEIHPECTKTEIREAWLRLSMQYHPDLNQDDEKAAQRFLEIKEAYTGERSTCWTYFKGRRLLQHAYFFIEVNCIELQN